MRTETIQSQSFPTWVLKIDWKGQCERTCDWLLLMSKSPRSLKNMPQRLKELWDRAINLQSDNQRKQPSLLLSHQSICVREAPGAGAGAAEWHWGTEACSLPPGAQAVTLIGTIIPAAPKGAFWLPNWDGEWELARWTFLLTALNINLVQLASQSHSYCCRNGNAFPGVSWLKILSHSSQLLIGNSYGWKQQSSSEPSWTQHSYVNHWEKWVQILVKLWRSLLPIVTNRTGDPMSRSIH